MTTVTDRTASAALTLAAIVGLTVGPATLAVAEESSAATTLDETDLAEFVDGFVTRQLEDAAIPGAVVAVVHDGRVLLERGYGVTEVDGATAVTPDRTLFDVGSVTKLFTATAVMQQVEAGRLDLHADVNRYLDGLEVPATFDEPVTTAHLLTHTGGFEERLFVGMLARSLDDVDPLEDNLTAHLPPRIRAPGTTHQYDNAGITLAGHLVERVSGRSFADYVAEHVTGPLGMTRTGFDPRTLDGEVATGHEATPGPATAVEPWYLHQIPAGGLHTTASDMSRFLVAHLGDSDDATAVLDAATREEMQTTAFTPHPGLAGFAHGFFEHEVGGRRGLHHGGDWVGFASLVYLLPDEGFGVFVSYNHAPGGSPARYELVEALLDRYFPVDAELPAAAGASADLDLDRFAGRYRTNRQDRHTFAQLASALMNPTLEVAAGDDGTLVTSSSHPLVPSGRWVPRGDDVFVAVDTGDTMAFDVDATGAVERVHVTWPLLLTMEPASWYEGGFDAIVLLAVLAVVLVTAAAWPIGAFVRRRRGGDQRASELRLAGRLAGGAATVLVLFVLAMVASLAVAAPSLLGVTGLTRGLLVLPVIAALLIGALVVVETRLVLRGTGTLAARLRTGAVTALLVACLPALYGWGLLGFHY